MEKEKQNNINRISAYKQWMVMMRQYRLVLLSDKRNLIVSIMFPVLAALITVWIAGKDMFVNFEGTKSGSFVIVSAAIWGGLFNSIQTVVKERANIKRDYITGLRIRCYTGSRAIIQFILCFLQSLIICISYFAIKVIYHNDVPAKGLLGGPAFLEYFISILLLMYAADMMGLMISCIVKKTETANVLAPYVLIVQLIFSGILFEMKGASEIVSYIMISRWGMEALGSISKLNDMQLKIQETVPNVPHEAEAMFNASGVHLLRVWGILILFGMIFILIGNLLLHRVSKDTR